MRNKVIFSVLLFSIISLSITPSIAKDLKGEKKSAEFNQQGINALNKNEYLQAIDYFQRALQIMPDNITIKKNLAVTYNNYAISLNEENNVEDAKEYLYKAIELEKDNIQYKENLSNIISKLAERYYQNGSYELAIMELKESIALVPNHLPSLVLLGHVYYQMQDLVKAQELWERAYKYNPDNKELRQLLSKLKDEKKIESQLKYLDAYYFDIRFDKDVIEKEIYDIRLYLQEAYRDIGRDFNYYPQHKIQVIFYKQEDFKKLRQTPDWVSGIYDGKIRLPVPTPSAERSKNGLSQIELKHLIWHEYTHAIVFYLTDGKCPIWFNEGLAKYEEGKIEKPNLTIIKENISKGTLIPLLNLNPAFSLKNKPEELNLAYMEAYSFIEFILDRWSFYVIRDVLEHLKRDKTIEEAFYEETNRSMKKLESDWREYLFD